jgi:hypothetical protein
MLDSHSIPTRADDEIMKMKAEKATEVLDRARASLSSGEINHETRRYLNTLFSSILLSEATMCW